MEFRDPQHFAAVADAGHLVRAAVRLGRSAPALTKSIHRPAQAFGAPLFERTRQGIRLTPSGTVLRERASTLQRIFEENSREIRNLSEGSRGHIKLGVAPTVAQYLMPLACRLFLRTCPDVTFDMAIGIYPILRESLKSGRIDLAIGTVASGHEFISQKIIHDDVVVVTGNNSDIFRKTVTLPDLCNYQWVLPAASYEADTREWLERVFDKHQLPRPRVQIETDSISLLPRMIAQTGLLSFISRRNLGPGKIAAPLREVPLRATTMRRYFGASYRLGGYLPPATRRFLEFIVAKGPGLFSSE